MPVAALAVRSAIRARAVGRARAVVDDGAGTVAARAGAAGAGSFCRVYSQSAHTLASLPICIARADDFLLGGLDWILGDADALRGAHAGRHRRETRRSVDGRTAFEAKEVAT